MTVIVGRWWPSLVPFGRPRDGPACPRKDQLRDPDGVPGLQVCGWAKTEPARPRAQVVTCRDVTGKLRVKVQAKCATGELSRFGAPELSKLARQPNGISDET